MGVSFDFQKALYDALTGDAELMALLVGGVKDYVPQDYEDFPYITIGDAPEITDWSDDLEVAYEAFFTIHTWSLARSNSEALNIMDAIRAALHRQTITDDNVLTNSIDVETSTVLKDPDGISRHGVQQLRIIYSEITS